MLGHRGYITGRPFMGQRAPQHIQNIIIRDYCHKNGLHYLLSVTEHVMPDSYIILNQVINELENLEGVVIYSIFQLPEQDELRHAVYEKVLKQKRSLHSAVERLVIKAAEDVERVEDIWCVQKIIQNHLLNLEELQCKN